MDRLCYYLRMGLWDLAESVLYVEKTDSESSKKNSQRVCLWETILNANQLCLHSPVVSAPWQQTYLASSIIHHGATVKGGELASPINIESRRKMAELLCILYSLNPVPSTEVIENLSLLYDSIIHADQNKEKINHLTVEAHNFLSRCLMEDAVSANTIIQNLLCLWCPIFSRTDDELQELYYESLGGAFQLLEKKYTSHSEDEGSMTKEDAEGDLKINISELLLNLSLFEVSEEKEAQLINWISTHLLEIYKSGVLSREMIYLALLSRFKLKPLKCLSAVETRFYCDIRCCEDVIVLQDMFHKYISFHGQICVEELFHMMMATRNHWMQYIIDTCSRLIMIGNPDIRQLCLDHQVVRKILPLLSINLWCNFIGSSGMFDAVSVLVDDCQKFKTDPLFSHMHGVLEHQMQLVIWCKMYGRNPALQNNEILHMVKENSTLETIRRTTNLAEVDWEKVEEILVQSHIQEGQSQSSGMSTAYGQPSCHWDVITFEGFCIIMMAFQIIQNAIEVENLATLKHPPTDTDTHCVEDHDLKKLYTESVARKTQEMQQRICHIFPLNVRIELLEDIFSLLFLRYENLQEESSSESGAEEEEEAFEVKGLESSVCGLSSDSSDKLLSSHSGEFSRDVLDPKSTGISSVSYDILQSCVNNTNVPECRPAGQFVHTQGEPNVKHINSKTLHNITSVDELECSVTTSLLNKTESKSLPLSSRKKSKKHSLSLEPCDKKTFHGKIDKCNIRHGFVCGVNLTRDILHCIKECVINASRTFYTSNAENDASSLYNDKVPSSVPVDSLQQHLNRLSQNVSESCWRLQLLADVDFMNHIGQFHQHIDTTCSDYLSFTWQYSSEECESESEDDSEFNEQSPGEVFSKSLTNRRFKSETEKSSESGSLSTPGGVSAGQCHYKTRYQKQTIRPPISDNIITRMLSTESSLIVQCLTKGDFAKANQVIQMCDVENVPLAVDVTFSEAYQTLRQKLKICAEGNSGELQLLQSSSPGGLGTFDFHQRKLMNTVPSLQSIKKVATAGVHSTSLTSEVERFLTVNPLPVVQDISEVIDDFPQVINMVKVADSGISLATMDLALTVGVTYEHSVSLLDLVCKHCSDLQVTGLQGSASSDIPGSIHFMQNMIQILKLPSTEHTEEKSNSLLSYKMSLCDVLSCVHSLISPKSLKEHISLWNTIFSSAKDFEESEDTCNAVISSSAEPSPESKEISDKKEHSIFKKLMMVVGNSMVTKESLKMPTGGDDGNKPGIRYLEQLYSYLKILSVHLLQNVPASKGFVSPPTYFSLLQENLVDLFGRLVFEQDVAPNLLEPAARKIHHNLVYSVVRSCCPIVPDRSFVREEPRHQNLKDDNGVTWGKVVLNDRKQEDFEFSLHPEVTVRNLLSDLLEVLTHHGIGGVLPQEVAVGLSSNPEVQQVLSDTQFLWMVNMTLLVPGVETLTFFINLTNLLWIHSLLVLECERLKSGDEEAELEGKQMSFGLLSTCPLKRLISLKCVGYNIGQLGFLSLYTLQQLLFGKELAFPFELSLKSFIGTEKEENRKKSLSDLNLSADPRSLFVLTNGQKHSPKVQVMNVENIDMQLDKAVAEYLDHSVVFSDSGQLILPHLLQCYQDVVSLNQEPESCATLPALARSGSPNHFSSDTDSVERKSFSSKENLIHLMDFVRDNTSPTLQRKLTEFSKIISKAEIENVKEYVVVNKPSYEFSIVLDYSGSDSTVASSESSFQCPDIQGTTCEKIVIPDIVSKFLESHCWLLSVLIHKIHQQNELAGSISEVQSPELDDRTRYLNNLFTADWISILRTVFICNGGKAEVTALHPEPNDEILWGCLKKLLQDRQWKICKEILWALPEIILHADSKLQSLSDDVLSELASKLPEKECPNPWMFCHHIGSIVKQAECVLRNLPLWPGSACIEVLRAMLEDNCRKLPEMTRCQLELNLHKIQIYDQILSCCISSDTKSWYDVSCSSESDPGLILAQLINGKKFQLCLQWANLHGIQNRFQQLVDHKFLLLLLDPEPPDFAAARELLLTLSPSQAVRICNDVLQQLKNLSCMKYVVNFVLDSLSSELQPVELTHYRFMSIGIQMVALLPSNEQPFFWDLMSQPQLIVEQLIMNTRLKLLENILKVLHPVLSQFPTNSPISVNNIDTVLREYATKALDFRVRQTQASSWSYPREEKLLVSLSVASSHSEEFLMPAEVPAKTDWVPNDAVSQCMCCKSVNFSMFNRRHHCRRCGRVICAMCSTKRMKVAGYRDVNVRVCSCCYEQSQHPDLLTGTSNLDSLLETSSSAILNFWKLTLDVNHNLTVREEFGFEHAPSVSLCLSILQLHSEQTAYPRFLVDSCDQILCLLQPVGPGTVNPEVDHGLVIRMVRSLVVAAKVKYARYGLNTGIVACDQVLSQVDLLSILVKSGCSALIPAESLNGKVLRRLRDRLVKEEMWTVAMEVSTKSGLDRAGVWAAWGKACLQAGCWEEAREKFSHCLERVTPDSDSTRPLRNPPLLSEIIQILETGAYSVDRSVLQQKGEVKVSKDLAVSSSFSSSALSVLHTLGSLKDTTQGKYNEAAPPSNTIIIGPKLDSLFYSECCYYLNTYGSHSGIVAFYLTHDDLPAALQHIQQQKVDNDIFLETIYLPCLIQGNTATLHQEMSLLDPSLEIWKSYLCHVCRHLERKGFLNILYQLQLFLHDYVRAAMTCIRFYQSGARTYSDLARNIMYLQHAQSHLEKELGVVQWGVKGDLCAQSLSSVQMKLEPREVDRHINTVLRQMEVTKFLGNCENQKRSVLDLLPDLFPTGEASHVPTLFGNSLERNQLAVLAVLCGRNVEEGFGIAFRIIQDYNLKALKIFSLVGRKLANDSQLGNIEQLIGCIQSSGMSDVNTLCDEVLAVCIQALAAKQDPGDFESLVKLMVDVGYKVSAYIELKQLKSAYLLAVKYDRLGDVRRILRAAEQLGQTAIQKICAKRLENSSSS